MLGSSNQGGSEEASESEEEEEEAKEEGAKGHKNGNGNGEAGSVEGVPGSNDIAPPPQMVASQAEAFAALLGTPQVSIQALDYYRVPLFLLPIYQAAEAQYGVPWQVLAAINEVETDYGNDLAVSTAGAVGWMQFMPETWLRYGVDVENSGYADPNNPVDAVFAAARYLRAAGAAQNLKGAIFAYNHSQAYVESVMLRAKLIADYPADVIATLTGLAEGQMPVANALATGESEISTGASSPTALGADGSSTHTGSQAESEEGVSEIEGEGGAGSLGTAPSPSASAAGVTRRPRRQRFVELSAPASAPVVAVQDGKVIAIGRSRRLGRYLVLKDVFGDTYTYAGLGSIARTYTVPKQTRGSVPGVALAGAEGSGEEAPSQAATEGSQPPVTLKVQDANASKGTAGKGNSQEGESQTGEGAAEAGRTLGKVRMFAHPDNQYAKSTIAKASAAGNLAGRLRPLRRGAVISAGTVLGSTTVTQGSSRGEMKLSISPDGDQSTVAAQPILQSWRQLYASLHPQGARRDAGLLGATAGDAFMLSKPALESAVLSDPGIGLDACVRQDISFGAVSTRPLATLVFLSRSGLKPTVGALPCVRRVKGGFSAAGKPVQGSFQSLAITGVNGIEIAGHEGTGSIADLTIRTLLTLQGKFAPSEIVSLMRYPGSPQTLASSHRPKSILIVYASGAAGSAAEASTAGTVKAAANVGSGKQGSGASPTLGGAIGTSQWSSLVQLVGSLPQPKVRRHRSSEAVSDPSVEGGAGSSSQSKP
ncbi:MAG TPA: lytic murein transglycosylase [Solirubrobacteraceae bacterium]